MREIERELSDINFILIINKMKIETDCPWCEIRKSHSSHPYLNQTILPSKVLKKREKTFVLREII